MRRKHCTWSMDWQYDQHKKNSCLASEDKVDGLLTPLLLLLLLLLEVLEVLDVLDVEDEVLLASANLKG